MWFKTTTTLIVFLLLCPWSSIRFSSIFLPRFSCFPKPCAVPETIILLNVSYDPTRELYQAFNDLSKRHTRRKPGKMSSSSSLMADPGNKRAPLSMGSLQMW